MLLEGLFLPLTTPFYPDGRLYLRKLEHNAERYSRTLAAGLAVLTPAGEPSRLTDEEKLSILKTVAEACARETLLLADISHGGLAGCLNLVNAADALNYDVALLRLPTLASGATEAEQRLLAKAVADRSPLPIVLMDETHESLHPSFVAGLAAHPQIIGWVASASGRDAVQDVVMQTREIEREVTVTTVFAAFTRRMQQRSGAVGGGSYISADSLTGATGPALAVASPEPAIRTRTKRVRFQVLAGRTEGALQLLRAGAGGAMLPFGLCTPQACHEVFSAWKDDDQLLAEEKYERIARGAALIEQGLSVAGLKAACDLNGYYGGRPRLPGTPLLGEQQQQVQAAMRGMRN